MRYQREAPEHDIAFPSGSTWVVFTDRVPHAAMNGQVVLERAFKLPVAAHLHPGLSPLRVLARLAARPRAA